MLLLGSEMAVNALYTFGGVIVTSVIGYFVTRNKNSTELKIAHINSSSSQFNEEVAKLRNELQEMKNSYEEIKAKYESEKRKNSEHSTVIKDYENLLRHYRFIFKLTYEMIAPKLEPSSEALTLLEEVKIMFSEDYKLK